MLILCDQNITLRQGFEHKMCLIIYDDLAYRKMPIVEAQRFSRELNFIKVWFRITKMKILNWCYFDNYTQNSQINYRILLKLNELKDCDKILCCVGFEGTYVFKHIYSV